MHIANVSIPEWFDLKVLAKGTVAPHYYQFQFLNGSI